jgi:hypothetical protein
MPRTSEEIIAHAEELAARSLGEPIPGDRRDPRFLAALREAVRRRAAAEQRIIETVTAARDGGYSWATIGSQLGTSGEAARQRYGHARH